MTRPRFGAARAGGKRVDERIGFIGLGIMGRPMATHLVAAGYEVTVWNRTQSKTAAVAQAGAKVGTSPKDVASKSDIIIISRSPTPLMCATW